MTRLPLQTACRLAAMACLFAGSLHAQNRTQDRLEAREDEILRIAAPEESAEPATADDRGAPDALAEADPTPFGVDLAAIRLISHQDQADLSGTEASATVGDAIAIDPSLSAPADLADRLRPYLGEPLSMALLAEMAKSVVEAWRGEHFPVVDVYFPEQNITSGLVQIVVREARLGTVRINDLVHSDAALLQSEIRLAPGDRLDRRLLENDLDWINRNPIRQVNLIYERGAEDGTSDIFLDAHEEKPLTTYLGFANSGVPLTGENEWSAGFEWLNPGGKEHALAYHHGADLEFETLESHSAVYRAFLPWRHELRFLGAAVFSDVPPDPSAPVGIGIGGENLQASLDYLVPLPRLDALPALRHEFLFGVDWKSTNTDLIFGGLNALASSAEILQFRLAWEAAWKDRAGHSLLTLASVWSPGGVLNHNDDTSFDLLRDGAGAEYGYAYAEWERSLKLPKDFRLVARARGQVSNDRLLSTEQMLAGGYLTVRGFDENLVRGDAGGIFNLEWIGPSFSLSDRFDPAGRPGSLPRDEWNLFTFFDAAALDIADPLPGELSPSLQSVGLGIVGRIGPNAHLRAAYGWALQTRGIDPRGLSHGRLHFGLTVEY